VPDEDRQNRQALAGAGVHPRLAPPLYFAVLQLVSPDRARCHPRAPAAGVFQGPLGDIEVEGPHLGECVPVVEPLDFRVRASAVGAGDGRVFGAHPLLPLPDDVRGEAETVSVGVVVLDVLPEALAKVVGERLQAVVVQSGLAFTEIVHQEVTDGTAAQSVAVDQFLGGPLSSVADLAQILRGILSQGPELVQQPVEHLGSRRHPLENPGLGLEELQDVADGDPGQHAALGCEDEGAAAESRADGTRP
jgi:hypothetical protein